MAASIISVDPNLSSTCAVCNKAASDLPSPLKRCARCRITAYCSRDCQKADWKAHKKICANAANAANSSNTPGPTSGAYMARNFFPSLADNTYLSSLSETDAFDQLIDSYRLRVEDDYSFRGELSGLYNQEDPLLHFREYLNLAEAQPGLLPKWWSKEKRTACERVAVDSSRWSDLSCAVEKHDIQEHYKDSVMPMKLRILAEKIYGKGVM